MVRVSRDRGLTARRSICVPISAQLATHEEWATAELRICDSPGLSKSIELPRAIEFQLDGWAGRLPQNDFEWRCGQPCVPVTPFGVGCPLGFCLCTVRV